MKNIVDKLKNLEKTVSSKKGPFHLFALLLREDASDVWDLIVSSPWASKDKTSALQYISKQLNKILSPNQMLKLSRIVIIEPGDPALEVMHKTIQAEHGTAELRDCNLFGLQIKHAFIITSKRRNSPNKTINPTGR